jgi:hypothetical protein
MVELNRSQSQLALKERNKVEPALEMVAEHREDSRQLPEDCQSGAASEIRRFAKARIES